MYGTTETSHLLARVIVNDVQKERGRGGFFRHWNLQAHIDSCVLRKFHNILTHDKPFIRCMLFWFGSKVFDLTARGGENNKSCRMILSGYLCMYQRYLNQLSLFQRQNTYKKKHTHTHTHTHTHKTNTFIYNKNKTKKLTTHRSDSSLAKGNKLMAAGLMSYILHKKKKKRKKKSYKKIRKLRMCCDNLSHKQTKKKV